jgi:hypothetical protein
LKQGVFALQEGIDRSIYCNAIGICRRQYLLQVEAKPIELNSGAQVLNRSKDQAPSKGVQETQPAACLDVVHASSLGASGVIRDLLDGGVHSEAEVNIVDDIKGVTRYEMRFKPPDGSALHPTTSKYSTTENENTQHLVTGQVT